MLLRARWFTLGMVAGSVVTLRVARALRSVTPGRLSPGDFADAWREGRKAMAQREAELRGLVVPRRPTLELVKPLTEQPVRTVRRWPE